MKNIFQNQNAKAVCEQILRTLPEWFGMEESLVEYAEATETLPTFVCEVDTTIVGFITLAKHFPESWEIHCIAVQSNFRKKGIGRALLAFSKDWIKTKGAKLLQVKTLAEAHPSAAYAETRLFYLREGFNPLEVFPTLWAEDLPVLLLVLKL
jgi:GNAT superfamily N-acetyltransferase